MIKRTLPPLFPPELWQAILPLFLSLPTEAIIIQLDYTYDTTNFFASGSAERDRLEEAAQFFEILIEDDLDPISPTGIYAIFLPESWRINFIHPSTGALQTIDDLHIPTDTIIIYVGSRPLPGEQFGEGGFAGSSTISIAGSSFSNAVATRGESGVNATDFAPAAGYLSVDSDTTWDTSQFGGTSNQHLYSTLLHEIAHVLGLGTAPSWSHQITNGQFTGPMSSAEFGGSVPLDFNDDKARYDHWAVGTTSIIRGTSTPQEAAMDPNIPAGDIKLFTNLDVAGLDDIGWDIAEFPLSPLEENYQAWLPIFFSESEIQSPALQATLWGMLADPDHDGQNNLHEFALDGDPLSFVPNQKVHTQLTDFEGNIHLTTTLPVRAGATFSGTDSLASDMDGIIYRIEGSHNLSMYDSVLEETIPALSDGLPMLNPGWEYRSFRHFLYTSASERAFLRIGVGTGGM